MSGEGKDKGRSILLIAVAVGLCYACSLLLDVDENVNCINIGEHAASENICYKQGIPVFAYI